MNKVIFETKEPSADDKWYRIRQVADLGEDGFEDCIIEFQVRGDDATGTLYEPDEWYPVDTDRECASVYMMAFLAERKKKD
jgi:hypothetical protein